jgi:hypothetical protein
MGGKHVVEITEKEYELFQKLKTIFKHAKAEQLEGVYFICGEGGEKDEMGLPEFISVCPAFGLDGFAYYKKHREYSAPEW